MDARQWLVVQAFVVEAYNRLPATTMTTLHQIHDSTSNAIILAEGVVRCFSLSLRGAHRL